MKYLKKFENYSGYEKEDSYNFAINKLKELKDNLKKFNAIDLKLEDLELTFTIDDIKFQATYQVDEYADDYPDNFYELDWVGGEYGDEHSGQSTDNPIEVIDAVIKGEKVYTQYLLRD